MKELEEVTNQRYSYITMRGGRDGVKGSNKLPRTRNLRENCQEYERVVAFSTQGIRREKEKTKEESSGVLAREWCAMEYCR